MADEIMRDFKKRNQARYNIHNNSKDWPGKDRFY